MMLHIPEVLSRDEVAEIRRRLDAADWVDGRVSAGDQGAKVKQNRQLPESSQTAIELGQIIVKALKRNPLFFSAALPNRILPPMFNSYSDGGHYGNHTDGAVRRVLDTDQWLRTDVSTTVFLNDPDEYEGGELVVEDLYGTHEVKLPAGDLILYPSTSIHRVMPVTRGARICSFLWTQSMIRDDMRRTILLDLDRNIQALRAKFGDCDELVNITGHYHNLLRQWAEI